MRFYMIVGVVFGGILAVGCAAPMQEADPVVGTTSVTSAPVRAVPRSAVRESPLSYDDPWGTGQVKRMLLGVDRTDPWGSSELPVWKDPPLMRDDPWSSPSPSLSKSAPGPDGF
jgi:hypothetical protein